MQRPDEMADGLVNLLIGRRVAADRLAGQPVGKPISAYQREARGDVAAILRTLRGYPESGRREHGTAWSPESLLEMAESLEKP